MKSKWFDDVVEPGGSNFESIEAGIGCIVRENGKFKEGEQVDAKGKMSRTQYFQNSVSMKGLGD